MQLPVVENWELEGFTKNTSCVTHARGTSVASILVSWCMFDVFIVILVGPCWL